MIPALIILAALLGLVLVAALFVAGIYNRLVTLRNRFKNAFAQIDVQLKRRYDLIPNLVEVARATSSTSARPSRPSSRPATSPRPPRSPPPPTPPTAPP